MTPPKGHDRRHTPIISLSGLSGNIDLDCGYRFQLVATGDGHLLQRRLKVKSLSNMNCIHKQTDFVESQGAEGAGERRRTGSGVGERH